MYLFNKLLSKVSTKNVVFILIFHLFCCLLFSQFGFLFGFSISKLYYPLSILISILVFRTNISSILFSLLIIGFSILLSFYIFDFSADGQGYHQETMIQIKNGWIPNDTPSLSRIMKVWIDHYPKGAETIQACIYYFFGRIEIAKSTNIILLVSSFLLTKKVLTYFNLNAKLSWIYSFLIAFNPVVISQVFTFYIDGIGYSFLICFIAVFYLYLKTKENIYIWLMLSILTVACSLKFTSIPIFGTIVFTTLLIMLIIRKFYLIKRLIIPMCLVPVLLIVCNYSPYITTFKEGKALFYPLRGDDAIDFIVRYVPNGFISENNRIEKLAFTLFSKTGSFDESNMDYKIPFSVSMKELNRLSDSDIGLGGFGIFYGGFLLVLILFFILNKNKLKSFNQEQKLLLLSIIPILFSVLIISEPWWVRYIPQFYLIPLFLLLILELNNKKINGLSVLKGILFANIFLFIGAILVLNIYNSEKTYYILNTLKNFKKEVKIDAKDFPSNLNRLEEYDISYKEIEIPYGYEPIIRFQPRGSVMIDDSTEKSEKNFVYELLNRFFYKID